MTTNKSTVRFAPWIGSQYENGFLGLRILLVGESHYGDKQHERPTVTPEIIKALALGERHPRATRKSPRKKHFTLIMSAVKNVRQRFSDAQRREFWNSVAYYNFLQEFISSSRILPSPDAWKRGEKAFTEVLTVLAPNLIICFSKRNGNRVRSLAGRVPVAVVNHPSSGFEYSKVNPIIIKHIDMAQKQRVLTPEFFSSVIFKRWSEATVYAFPSPGSHLSEPDKIALLAERRESMSAHDELLLK
ncbi:hypothetical protein OND84_004196 [Morganella morganii]|uniref:hypothetical protein n=1 Tax=Providencia huaxiensis TaxID=2027290 RepID=UPI002ADE976B|nr:hypothetical protein [Morganella morganii]EMB6212888.1 hypothetical protein [Morganella morganii]